MTITTTKKNPIVVSAATIEAFRKARRQMPEHYVNADGQPDVRLVEATPIMFHLGSFYLIRTGKDTAEWYKLQAAS